MNNRNVDILRIAKIKNTFFFLHSKHRYTSDIGTWSKILNIQDGSRGDGKHQRRKKKEIKETKIHFPEAVSKLKWQHRKKMTASYSFMFCHFYSAHIIVAHRKWTRMVDSFIFFFTALPRTIAPAPRLRLRHNYADKRQETVNDPFFFCFFSFNTDGLRAVNVYLSQTLVKGLRLFTHGYVNMVQHHLTDEVSDPASVFLHFLFLYEKTQLPTVPGVYSCQRSDCTATNQPLSGGDGGFEAVASGRTGRYGAAVTYVKVTIVHARGCPTGM